MKRELMLAQNLHDNIEPTNIDILVGSEEITNILTEGMFHILNHNVSVVPSIFGHVLFGRAGKMRPHVRQYSTTTDFNGAGQYLGHSRIFNEQTFCNFLSNSDLDKQLKRFWKTEDAESHYKVSDEKTEEDEMSLKIFKIL